MLEIEWSEGAVTSENMKRNCQKKIQERRIICKEIERILVM